MMKMQNLQNLSQRETICNNSRKEISHKETEMDSGSKLMMTSKLEKSLNLESTNSDWFIKTQTTIIRVEFSKEIASTLMTCFKTLLTKRQRLKVHQLVKMVKIDRRLVCLWVQELQHHKIKKSLTCSFHRMKKEVVCSLMKTTQAECEFK